MLLANLPLIVRAAFSGASLMQMIKQLNIKPGA